MTLSNDTVIARFAKRATQGKSANIFIEGDILYDYGHHFPLLVRMPWGLLMNADKYSVTTSCHQSIASRHAKALIPFSVLASAGIQKYQQWRDATRNRIELVDQEKERWDITGYARRNSVTNKREYISVSQWETMTGMSKKEWDEMTERRPSAYVLKVEDKYYLSSMDGANYFLSLLPGPVSTYQEAFDSLFPSNHGIQDLCSNQYLRQGEWFFFPVSVSGRRIKRTTCTLTTRNYRTGCFLNNRLSDSKLKGTDTYAEPHHYVSKHHMATYFGIPYPLVRGTVRHTRRDHHMLKLRDGKTWYAAVESRHVQSWEANGEVD